MRLDPDCVRDTLLYLEGQLVVTPELEFKPFALSQIEKDLPYSREELANTLLILGEAGFIQEMHDLDVGNKLCQMAVSRITYAGYQFIATIRPKTVWNKTLCILKQFGSFSLGLARYVSVEVAKAELSSIIGTFLKGGNDT